jgi:hypothetical protein
MSTPQSIHGTTPQSRIGRRAAPAALGVLIAIAATITMLALTNANHSRVSTSATATQAAFGTTPRTNYSGLPQPGNQAVHYICFMDKYCLRCLADNFCTR